LAKKIKLSGGFNLTLTDNLLETVCIGILWWIQKGKVTVQNF